MEYTEKTSGSQIEQLIKKILDDHDAALCELAYDRNIIGITRLHDIPTIGPLYNALVECGINPWFVSIDKDSWGHLVMWFCNWDGTDINLEN